MTVAHLSQEWLDLRQQLASSLPARPGATARVQTVVAKTPNGEVAYVESFEDGRLVAATLGADDGADCTVNVTYADSLAIARGEVAVHTGFMQGRVKVAGNTNALFTLVPVLRSEEYAALGAELAGQTDL